MIHMMVLLIPESLVLASAWILEGLQVFPVSRLYHWDKISRGQRKVGEDLQVPPRAIWPIKESAMLVSVLCGSALRICSPL